ncbi:META and DUF4377 domain-containing protein [Chitinibacter sp. SCUT-21]|uniref:DUF4377 domain-containing protein n=1 Tax=Chitinibacter sp. SCUT-21 TaxID=2970891 RepID=UPI0035A657DE
MKKIIVLASALVGIAHAATPQAQTSWLGDYELIEFKSAGQSVNLPNHKPITLSLSRGGKVTGFSGCNQFQSAIKASPLAMGMIASTRKMCPEPIMQFEHNYLAALEGLTAIERNADKQLVVSTANNQQLIFKMSTKAVEKVIWVGPEKKDCVAGVMKTQCLQYKTSANGQWMNFYGAIDGFEWEQGKSYKLKIRQEKIANPPADASSLKTSLVKVLSSQ